LETFTFFLAGWSHNADATFKKLGNFTLVYEAAKGMPTRWNNEDRPQYPVTDIWGMIEQAKVSDR
jgi:hypothetical protein